MELLNIDEIISACEASVLEVVIIRIDDIVREGIKNV